MIFMFGCTIKTKGKFPENECFVIMANHASFLDVFAIPTVFKGRFSAVAAAFSFKIPLYSIFLKKLKVVPINRLNKEQAIAGINMAEKVLKEGYHIVILPEGTRTITGDLGKFKKGGFHLAKNANARILPVFTNGLYKIKPKNRWTINPGIIKINIGAPLETSNKNIEELLKETEELFLSFKN
jgi:1-acyl-sn-glycerol-3-phosphate acyltransferase